MFQKFILKVHSSGLSGIPHGHSSFEGPWGAVTSEISRLSKLQQQ